jgi:ADP-ribose pyrophosphatase YjhB (NUDIX family)
VNAPAPVPIRRAARALIVDADERVLLFRGDLADRDPWWFAPGGALEPGETYATALVREVMEETALIVDAVALGPPIWARESVFTWLGKPERHVERFFLVRVVSHDVDTNQFEKAASAVVRRFRWWTVDDILVSPERFSPVRLGDHLAALFRDGAPDQPVTIGE